MVGPPRIHPFSALTSQGPLLRYPLFLICLSHVILPRPLSVFTLFALVPTRGISSRSQLSVPCCSISNPRRNGQRATGTSDSILSKGMPTRWLPNDLRHHSTFHRPLREVLSHPWLKFICSTTSRRVSIPGVVPEPGSSAFLLLFVLESTHHYGSSYHPSFLQPTTL